MLRIGPIMRLKSLQQNSTIHNLYIIITIFFFISTTISNLQPSTTILNQLPDQLVPTIILNFLELTVPA